MSLSGSDKKELVSLLHALREDTISDEQFDRLEEIIKGNQQAQKYYVDYFMLCHDLSFESYFSGSEEKRSSQEDCVSQKFDSDLWGALADDEKNAPSIQIEKQISGDAQQDTPEPAKNERRISKLSIYTFVLSTAAMLFIAVMLILKPVPPIVATLTDSIDAEWTSTEKILTIGDVLRQGDLTLAKGYIEITFNKGAQVIVEAPAKIELIDSNRMFLHEGKLAAQVTHEAFGFTVDTPEASFRDIGTEFGVEVKKNNHSDLHVFKGEVVLFTGLETEGQESNKERVVLKEKQARRVRTGSMVSEEITVQSNMFIRSREDAIYKIETGGNIRYFKSSPPSFEMDQVEDDNYINMFLESKRVETADSVLAGFVGPGSFIPQTYSQDNDKIIPAGTRVDSYLIHLDLDNSITGQVKTLNGSVTFPRPIIGLLVSTEQMAKTDNQFGARGTIYTSTKARGLTGEDPNNSYYDILTVSEDRHTLDLKLVVANIDQIRVLIEAPEDEYAN